MSRKKKIICVKEGYIEKAKCRYITEANAHVR